MTIYDLSGIKELEEYKSIIRNIEIPHFKPIHIKHTNLYYVSDFLPKMILLAVKDHRNYYHLPLCSGVSYLTKEKTIEAVKETYEYLRIKYL